MHKDRVLIIKFIIKDDVIYSFNGWVKPRAINVKNITDTNINRNKKVDDNTNIKKNFNSLKDTNVRDVNNVNKQNKQQFSTPTSLSHTTFLKANM